MGIVFESSCLLKSLVFVLPSLAIIRIAVIDTSGNLVGQRFLKVDGLRPGYR